MSIVGYYLRLSPEQLDAVGQQPEALLAGSLEHLPDAELIDLDRSWEPMAWLVSPCKRAEQREFASAIDEELTPKAEAKPTFFSRLTQWLPISRPREPSTRSVASDEKGKAEPDSLLKAIEGRSDTRDNRIDFGYGAAAIFTVVDVERLHRALEGVNETSLRQQYNAELMDRLHVFPEHWMEEGDTLMDEYVLPNLIKLQRFYAEAARSRQAVLIWFA